MKPAALQPKLHMHKVRGPFFSFCFLVVLLTDSKRVFNSAGYGFVIALCSSEGIADREHNWIPRMGFSSAIQLLREPLFFFFAMARGWVQSISRK